MTAAKEKVHEICTDPEGCTKPVFAKEKCSAHYQRDRREALGLKVVSKGKPVKQYGGGYNRVSGCVTDDRFKKLKVLADREHGGSMYSLVQEVMSLYADGQD